MYVLLVALVLGRLRLYQLRLIFTKQSKVSNWLTAFQEMSRIAGHRSH